MKKSIFILLPIIILLAIFGMEVPQKNSEELFLSDYDSLELKQFQEKFGVDQTVLVLYPQDAKTLPYFDSFKNVDAQIIDLSQFKKNQFVAKLPNMSDLDKWALFEEIESKFPELKIIGMPYTNAHLAGMSVKIQKQVFPLVFVSIFLLSLLIFKSFLIASWLFFNAFISVPLSLSLIKLIYGHSTILTSISPLVCFILSFSLFIHLYFGFKKYQNKKILYQRKLRPILIMMVTTLAGFLGLMNSELACIRQFSIITFISLLLTWLITMGIFHFSHLEIKETKLLLIKNIFSFKLNKLSAWVIIFVSIFLGSYSFLKIHPLTEAVFFFAKDHPLRVSLNHLSELSQGVPQLDVVITRKDQMDLEFSDFKKIEELEESINKVITGNQEILSINNMVKRANLIYSGVNALPDFSISYFALKSKVPQALTESYINASDYRLSLMAPPLKDSERLQMINSVQNIIGSTALNSFYSLKLSGLSYLMYKSQTHLLKSLVNSFLISFLVITLVFSLFSRKFKEILIFMLINFASMSGGFFFIYLFGITLNVSSIMTVSITIGLVVDSTIHILHALKDSDSEESLKRIVHPSILSSHLIFILGFSILTFQNFIPIRDFALGLIILMLFGLFMDLWVLTALEDKSKVI